ncbi:MAG: amidohydrolase family protein [Planctomycetes bacterium]|nr:amidohydrolase family protein [Planctomycetota bacterium]
MLLNPIRPAALRSTLSVLALVLAAGVAVAQDRIAIKAGRIITQAGPEILNGVIVIENGRISAIGADVKVPWDVPVLDASKMTAMPGFVEAHSFRGMDRPNENVDVAPFLSVRDSIDPIAFYFEECLRYGITTINVQQGNQCVIGGQGLIVKPFGLTVEEMLVRPDAGLKLSATPKFGFSSATQAQSLRNAFGELRRHLEQLVADAKDGNDRARREALFQGRDLEGEKGKGKAMGGTTWKVDGLELVPRGEVDGKMEPLLDLVEGRVNAYIYCGRAMDVRTALEVARDNGFLARTTLIVDGSCWKAAAQIAEAGVPVVLGAPLTVIERDPITGKETETFAPTEFQKKGVRFAFSSSNSTTESLWFQAATAVANGFTREAALDAVTKNAAEFLGLGKRLGSLEVGKDGNVALFSGDPLSITATVQYVVIEGKQVYDRSKDIRVKSLMEGKIPAGTTPMGGDADAGHVHDDGCGTIGDDEHDAKKDDKDKKDEKKPADKKDEKKEEKKDDKTGDEKKGSGN